MTGLREEWAQQPQSATEKARPKRHKKHRCGRPPVVGGAEGGWTVPTLLFEAGGLGCAGFLRLCPDEALASQCPAPERIAGLRNERMK